MVDDNDLNTDSDLRRRAAWLLVMLAIVAVLLVVVISALVGSDNGGGTDNAGPGPLDQFATSTGQHHSPAPASSSHSTHHKPHNRPGGGASSSASTSVAPVGHTSCPTQQTCILDGDIGNAIQAINDYRVQHGQPAKPGAVTLPAQTCAVHNGNGCSGGWAETELSTPDGDEAVQKILEFGRLLDPQLKDFEVGWAYDPGAKLYYFAIIRND